MDTPRASALWAALRRITQTMHTDPRLEALLPLVTREIRELLGVAGASVILHDPQSDEFYFPAAAYENPATAERFTGIRFAADQGVAGRVFRSGEALIVPDTAACPFFLNTVDQRSGFTTRSMLDVPLWAGDHCIGVLCAVNKRTGDFDDGDVALLETVAGVVGLPIENARITAALSESTADLRSLNRAKEQVIHHLSHELKTPLAVLTASFTLLRKRLGRRAGAGSLKVIARAQRNLQRLLEMQYEIEDLLREKDYRTHNLLSRLVDACQDELAVLASRYYGEADAVEKIRDRIDTLFGPRQVKSEEIVLDRFVSGYLNRLKADFGHRRCELHTDFQAVAPISIPREILEKVVAGLVRNAVENTPDGGHIEVRVLSVGGRPELAVTDFGVGITATKQRLLFNRFFAPHDPLQRTARAPYAFNAGGRGFDLLRMKLFSEQYGFQIRLTSQRCPHIPTDADTCPGDVRRCAPLDSPADCRSSGYTSLRLCFGGEVRDQADLHRTLRAPAPAKAIAPPMAALAAGPAEMRPPLPVDERFFERLQVEFLVHELKDPLSVIESGLRMLVEKQSKFGALSQRQNRTLGRALRSSRRARQMLSGLLEVGRAEDRHFACQQFRPEKVLREVAVDCLELMVGPRGPSDEADTPAQVDQWLEANGLHLVLSDGGGPHGLCQDEEKVRHIVANLIKNALHHRHQHITVSCHWDERRTRIKVQDDGPGVPAEHRELIFQRYAQLETPTGVKRRGYGLGLAGARHLARSLDGDVRIHDGAGQGACFEVTLPTDFTAGRSDAAAPTER
ncbi:MAG: GAF domain-containing sensor histidine kinase [Desulfosarcinaceae bacterium]|nr:GAF domain-containing sensor histidine kinase [Desulfosarcinaceae bacterium]